MGACAASTRTGAPSAEVRGDEGSVCHEERCYFSRLSDHNSSSIRGALAGREAAGLVCVQRDVQRLGIPVPLRESVRVSQAAEVTSGSQDIETAAGHRRTTSGSTTILDLKGTADIWRVPP
jgi:hypothetical protein